MSAIPHALSLKKNPLSTFSLGCDGVRSFVSVFRFEGVSVMMDDELLVYVFMIVGYVIHVG